MPSRPNLRPTLLLAEAREGHYESARELFLLLRRHLRTMVGVRIRRFQQREPLQATAFVRQSWIDLIDPDALGTNAEGCRLEFANIAARAIRQILVDHARQRQRHDAADLSIWLGHDSTAQSIDQDGLLALDSALEALAAERLPAAQTAELRLFAGLTPNEIARQLQTSPTSVAAEWDRAHRNLMVTVQASAAAQARSASPSY